LKLPRDLDARRLIKALSVLGYEPVRQSGSHVRIECRMPTPHAVTIPDHSPLKIGTLSAILADVATHHQMSREQLLQQLFG
jgi:predicted RNA binding protein YcfA (HicA-like mRNA interferase family)